MRLTQALGSFVKPFVQTPLVALEIPLLNNSAIHEHALDTAKACSLSWVINRLIDRF